MPADTVESIIKAVRRDLAEDGTFIAYQLRGHVVRYAQEEFGNPDSENWVLWNLPPLRVFTWRKT